MNKNNIILIGFMGAGKTAVGQSLAQELQLDFIDCDQLIELSEKMSISDIFAKKGEACFRDLETKTIESLSRKTNLVVATGGGMVLRPENVTMLKALGPVVLLWAKPEIIYQRIKNEGHRPLLNVPDPVGEINKILSARQAIYQRVADFKIDTSNLKILKIVEEIKQWLKLQSN